MNTAVNSGPTGVGERYVFLDALRGLALVGIALANFPEFGLWTFLSTESQAAMPTSGVDRLVRFLQYVFVDGKFYTIFSLLFGVGFCVPRAGLAAACFLERGAASAAGVFFSCVFFADIFCSFSTDNIT